MNKKDLNQRIQALELMESLSKAYAEISSSRMKKIRSSVVTNRDFLGALDEIFKEVRASYRRETARLAKKKQGQALTFLVHNGKTAAVLISANTGLYGDIIPKTFNLFLQEIRRQDVEATIIGRLGLSLFLEVEPSRPYTYFDFPDYGIDSSKLSEVVKHLVQYEEIKAFYGRFDSIVKQTPVSFNISAETSSLTNPEEEEKVKYKYLFEPSLEEILIFFETEMFTSLMEQSIREGQLAKFAARMLAMDQAGQNVKQELSKTKLDKLRLMHALANRKQLNSLSASLNSRVRTNGR